MKYAAAVLFAVVATVFLQASAPAAPPAPPDADWPMLGHDAGRSGATAAEVRPPFARKWYRAFPDEGIMAGVQPVTAGGRVYVGTMCGVMHALDAATGRDVWSHRVEGAILHTAAVAFDEEAGDDLVVFATADGHVYAVAAEKGRVRWKVKIDGCSFWNAPAIHGGLALLGGRDGRLYAFDLATGAVRWSAPTGGPLLCSPAVDAKRNRVYVGSEDMRVYAFDLATGRGVWTGDQLPGVSFRGYHPVVAPDGSVLITSTPCAGGDTMQGVLLDMVKAVFGDFASWRHTKEENERLRAANFELMKKPETYSKQLDYLRRRLTDEPALQTLFVLDPETGKQKFVAPVVYAESMNGPAAPPLVAPDGRVIVKYSALLRSRYEHYSPFLNVGALDTTSGHVEPLMDQSRTYGWHDSLLLVHDEQSQLAVGGRVLVNTHQDNVNAMDLTTRDGFPSALAHNVHEAQPGLAAAIWAHHLAGDEIPAGWEWFARGTAVYGGGSVIDVPITIAGDSFYYLPTHEINAGCVVVAYRMDTAGRASDRTPPPSRKLADGQWQTIRRDNKWDWDTLEMNRLNVTLDGLPEAVPGTRRRPLTREAEEQVRQIADEQLDAIIWEAPTFTPAAADHPRRAELSVKVEELISHTWRPLVFPAGKHPAEAYRFFTDPVETVYTLALAYPHLTSATQRRVRDHVVTLDGPKGSLENGHYDPQAGDVRSLYDPAPDPLLKIVNDGTRTATGRLYVHWLWAHATGDWSRLKTEWPELRQTVDPAPAADAEIDLGNGRLAGLIAACRIARELKDDDATARLLPQTRQAMRDRLVYELAHPEGGLIVPAPVLRTVFGRWRNLTPDVARLLRTFARDAHHRLLDVYVDHHRPTWWLAWNVETLWRNETPLSFPTAALEVFAARAMILGEDAGRLDTYVDIPWCRGDEFYVQKLAMLMNAPRNGPR